MEVSHFSNRLKETRKSKRIKQKELARKCNISRQVLYEYEKGIYYPNVIIAYRLANELGVSVEYLVTGKDLNSTFIKDE